MGRSSKVFAPFMTGNPSEECDERADGVSLGELWRLEDDGLDMVLAADHRVSRIVGFTWVLAGSIRYKVQARVG